MRPQEKINVLFLQSQLYFGADSLVHAEIMRHLDRDRFKVHVACVGSNGAGVPDSLAGLRQIPDVQLRVTHFAPGLQQRSLTSIISEGGPSFLFFPIDAASLVAYIRREKIRILHGTEKPRDAVYAVALGRLTAAKSVVHVHVKWSKEYSRPARWAVRNASGVFSITNYVTDTIAAMGTPRERVYTMHNCLEPSRWDPDIDGTPIRREYGIEDGAPLLVCVSRLFSWKGQRELIRAIPLVREEFPNVKLLIVGPDEPYVHGGSFSQELRALAESLGIAESVILTGGRSDIPRIMAAADVFTMPSYEEPFGVVFLEAMAMKKPVIAVNNGGTPEVVEHGRAGLLSPPWDVPALAANIRELLRSPERRRQMGEYGRARVLDYFNPKRLAREAGEAYESLLSR